MLDDSDPKEPSSSYRVAAITVGLGATLWLAVTLLRALGVGKFGQPANIGEGGLYLLSYAVMGVGGLSALMTYITRRRS